MQSMYPPSIIEKTGRNSKAFDLPTKLLENRIVYLGGPVDQFSADFIIMQLLWLDSISEEAISFYINSPGGCVYSGYGIKDVMDSINAKVNTLGVGMCASMGAFLLSSGTGTRTATKNCRIMLHSVSSGSRGTFHDMAIDLKETEYLQDKMMLDFAQFTKGKLVPGDIEQMTLRDNYMSPDEAIDFGFIDKKL